MGKEFEDKGYESKVIYPEKELLEFKEAAKNGLTKLREVGAKVLKNVESADNTDGASIQVSAMAVLGLAKMVITLHEIESALCLKALIYMLTSEMNEEELSEFIPKFTQNFSDGAIEYVNNLPSFMRDIPDTKENSGKGDGLIDNMSQKDLMASAFANIRNGGGKA